MVALILQCVLQPPFALLPMAPWIVFVILRSSFPKTACLATLAGALIDLLSEDPMGIHALNYSLTALFLYSLRKHFLYDRPLHLSLFTALFSATSTLLQLFLLFLFDRRVPFSGKWLFADLIGMPIADGIYALLWFAAPLYLYVKLRKLWSLHWPTLFPTSHS